MDNITTATPAEIDTELNTLSYAYAIAEARADQYSKLITSIEDGKDGWDKKYSLPRHQATLDSYITEMERLYPQIAELNDEFDRRGGWTRAFLAVTNGGGGHVHRNRSCVSCYPTTQYAWMTTFSGLDEDQIVDAAGERACTYCYPSAPVEVLNRPTQMFTPDEEAAQARKAELAAKKEAAARAAVRHAITGEVMFKTERAARNEISRLLGNAEMYDDAEDRALALGYIIHLANHLGVDAKEMSDELQAKAAAKYRKEAIKMIKQNLAHYSEMYRDPANWRESMRRIAKEEGLI